MPIPTNPLELLSLQVGQGQPNANTQATRKQIVEFVQTIRENIDASYRYSEAWRKAAEESYRFVENDQWDEKDRKFQESQRRPVMTNNKILPKLRLITGIERQNREVLRVFPRKGVGVDEADLMNQLISIVEDENLVHWQRIRKSNDVYVTGRGYLETDISNEENLEGDIVIRRRMPLTIFNDPLSDEWDQSDARWIAKADWVTEEEAKELWPTFADQIKVSEWLQGESATMAGELTGDRLKQSIVLDRKTKRVRVLTYWYKKRETAMIAINRDTGNARLASPAFLRFMALAATDEQRQGTAIIKRRVTRVWKAVVMNWLLLDHSPSPFDHAMFPIVPYVGLQYWRDPWGLVEYLKDPQRLRNKMLSQTLNHLNRSANSGWMNKKTGGADRRQLEMFGAVPGVTIDYEDVKPERIEPTQLSAGHLTLHQLADEDMNEISSINADLQGLNNRRTESGRAIEARQRGGLIGNEDLFDNMLLGDKIVGHQIISNIQQFYKPGRILELVESSSLQDPSSKASEFINSGNIEDIIQRTIKGEYKFSIDKKAAASTVRQEQAAELLDMAKNANMAPQEFPRFFTALVDFLDFPESVQAELKADLQTLGIQGQQQLLQQVLGQAGANAAPQPTIPQ